jgi:hypothetical protein
MEPGRREAEKAQDPAQAEDAPGTIDGPEQPRLGGRGDAQAREVRLEDREEHDEDAEDGAEATVALFQEGDPAP